MCYYCVIYNNFVFQQDSALDLHQTAAAAVQNFQLPFSWAVDP